MKYIIFLLATLLLIGCAPPHAINEMIIVYSAWESVHEIDRDSVDNFEQWEE